jgi:hypothetical protein
MANYPGEWDTAGCPSSTALARADEAGLSPGAVSPARAPPRVGSRVSYQVSRRLGVMPRPRAELPTRPGATQAVGTLLGHVRFFSPASPWRVGSEAGTRGEARALVGPEP